MVAFVPPPPPKPAPLSSCTIQFSSSMFNADSHFIFCIKPSKGTMATDWDGVDTHLHMPASATLHFPAQKQVNINLIKLKLTKTGFVVRALFTNGSSNTLPVVSLSAASLWSLATFSLGSVVSHKLYPSGPHSCGDENMQIREFKPTWGLRKENATCQSKETTLNGYFTWHRQSCLKSTVFGGMHAP